jgi:tetratricopeptide (TPR) repeat protein
MPVKRGSKHRLPNGSAPMAEGRAPRPQVETVSALSPQVSFSLRRRALSLGLPVLLFVLVLGAFVPVLRNDFISFDDGTYVTLNTHVQAGLSWAGLKWAFLSSEGSNWHPLTWLSHMLDCELFGLRPWGHHLTSIILHGLNTIALFFLLRKMTGSTWRSFFVAAFFGLHPLRVESVAWVAERKDVLSAFFFLLTLFAYARYAQRSTPAFYLWALLFFAFGLMSKPMLVTLPFVLLLLDYWPQSRAGRPPAPKGSVTPAVSFSPARRFGWLLIEKIPFFLLALASSVITFVVQNKAGATRMIGQLPVFARFENALISYCRYLGKLGWPVHLSIFYPHPGHWPLVEFMGAGLLLAILTTAAIRVRRQHPYLLVGWFWFLGTLVPVIGLVQVGRQSMADRYTYIPSIGLFIALVWGIDALAGSFPKRSDSEPLSDLAQVSTKAVRIQVWAKAGSLQTLALFAAVVGILLCGALTYHQAGCWRNSESLFRHALAIDRDNYLAHGNLGNALERQGKLAEAMGEYDEVLRLQPDDVNTRNGLGSLLLELGRTDDAIGQFEEALRRLPSFAEARNNLGYLFQRQGRLDQAIVQYELALKLNPSDFRIHINLATVLLRKGRTEESIRHLEAALKLKPDDVVTRNTLGSLLFNAGRAAEAIQQFEQAVRAAPDDAEAQGNLGIVLAQRGRRNEAIAHLTQALKLRPNYPEAEQQLRALEKTR